MAKQTAQMIERSMTVSREVLRGSSWSRRPVSDGMADVVSQTQRAVLASMKDLDDLSESEEEEGATAMVVVEVGDDDEVQQGEAERPKESSSRPAEGQAAVRPLPAYYRVTGSPIRACSSDLLLSCLSFLGDARTYTRVRGVCKAWAPVAEHEALWRPIAEAMMGRRGAHKSRGGTSSLGREEMKKGGHGHEDDEEGEQGKGEAVAASGGVLSSESPAPPKKPPSWMCNACGLIQVRAGKLR